MCLSEATLMLEGMEPTYAELFLDQVALRSWDNDSFKKHVSIELLQALRSP